MSGHRATSNQRTLSNPFQAVRLPCSSQSFALQTATEGKGLQGDPGFSASQFFLAQQQTHGEGLLEYTQEEQIICTHELWHMNCKMLLISVMS